MRIEGSRRFSRNVQMILTQSGSGPALVDPYRRTMVRLNPVAERIWQMLDGGRTVDKIIETLRDEFEVEEAELGTDVRVFLTELFRREMIA